MNSNLFHNILNVIIALLGVVTAVLLATGCTPLPGGGLECSKSLISPEYTSIAIAGLGLLKTVVNIVRDGPAGLVKPQPPVK